MNKTFEKVLKLIDSKDIKISEHGYDELASDNILIKDVLLNVKDAIIAED
jgi:hypothetical protein